MIHGLRDPTGAPPSLWLPRELRCTAACPEDQPLMGRGQEGGPTPASGTAALSGRSRKLSGHQRTMVSTLRHHSPFQNHECGCSWSRVVFPAEPGPGRVLWGGLQPWRRPQHSPGSDLLSEGVVHCFSLEGPKTDMDPLAPGVSEGLAFIPTGLTDGSRQRKTS